MADFKNLGEFSTNNDAFVASFSSGGKPMPPARKALLITCMDAVSLVLVCSATLEPDCCCRRAPPLRRRRRSG